MSLQQIPAEATLIVRCDLSPIVEVRKILESAGWEVIEKLFLPAERGFKLTAVKKG